MATTDPIGQKNAQLLARVALACALLGAVAILLLSIVRTDISPLHRFISEYAVDGPGVGWTWLMQSVFLLMAACAALLAMAGWHRDPCGKRAGRLLLIVAAGILVMFACKTNLNIAPFVETMVGKAHNIAAFFTFLSALGAMLVVCRQNAGQSRLAWILLAVGGLTLFIQMCLMIAHPRPYRWVGVTERIIITALLAWCVWYAQALCGADRAAEDE
jgi:hypothetical protein